MLLLYFPARSALSLRFPCFLYPISAYFLLFSCSLYPISAPCSLYPISAPCYLDLFGLFAAALLALVV